MRPSKSPENKSPSDTYLRAQSICKKVQAHKFFRATTETIAYGLFKIASSTFGPVTML